MQRLLRSMMCGALALAAMSVGTERDEPVSAADTTFTSELLADVNATGLESYPENYTEVNGTILFAASDESHGYEIFVYDPVTGEIGLLYDILPGPDNGFGYELGVLGSSAFFAGDDGVNGSELWITDGTTAGTRQFADLRPGDDAGDPRSSSPRDFVTVGSTLYFSALDADGDRQLWTTDGTVAGTMPLTSTSGSFEGDVDDLVAVEVSPSVTALFFSAQRSGDSRTTLWRYDEASGLQFVSLVGGSEGSNPRNLTAFDGALYVSAPIGSMNSSVFEVAGSPSVANDLGLEGRFVDIASDGSSVWVRTRPSIGSADIWQIATVGGAPDLVLEDEPIDGNLAVADKKLFFVLDDGGMKLMATDGSDVTELLEIPDFPGMGVALRADTGSGVVYVRVPSGDDRTQLWRSDGSTSGTERLSSDAVLNGEAEALELSDGSVVFTGAWGGARNFEPSLSTDEATSVQLAELNDATASSRPVDFTRLGDRTVFSADDGVHGFELWTHDPATGSTALLADLRPGSSHSRPGEITSFGDQVLFRADFDGLGSELGISDGTATGTRLLADLLPGTASSSPRDFIVLDDRAFFWALENTASFSEPRTWVTDGTAAGTIKVAEQPPQEVEPLGDGYVLSTTTTSGIVTSAVVYTDATSGGTSVELDDDWALSMAALGGEVFYEDNHSDLRRTDGTVAGTVPYAPMGPTDPVRFETFDGRLLVLENDGGTPVVWSSADADAAFTRHPTASTVGETTEFVWRGEVWEVDGRLFVELGSSGDTALGVFDGSTFTVFSPTAIGDDSIKRVFDHRGVVYAAGFARLWRLDGTDSTEIPIDRDVDDSLVPIGDALYFRSRTAAIGVEPYAFHLPGPPAPPPSPDPDVEFSSLEPGRVVETRTGDGLTTVDGRYEGDGQIAAGATYRVAITGRGGVPSTGVSAAAMNVTAVNPDGRGFLTIFPCGDQPLASSLNFGSAGAVVGNEVVAKLSDAGEVCIFSSERTHLTVDVVGYVPVDSTVTSLEPARLLETRSGPGLTTVDGVDEGEGRLEAGETRAVRVAGRGGVPATGAGAAVMNVTAVNPDGRGFVTVFPCGDQPLASSLNYGAAGAVVGNEVVAKLSSSGDVCLFTSERTHLTVDVVGFVPLASSVASLEPARLLETRDGVGLDTIDGLFEGEGVLAGGDVAEVRIAGRGGVPDTEVGAAVMNVTAVNPTGRGFLTIYPCGTRPLASGLNFAAAGAVVGNEVIAKLDTDGDVCVFSSASTHLTIDVVGFVPA